MNIITITFGAVDKLDDKYLLEDDGILVKVAD